MGASANFALRLPASLKAAASALAKADGTTLNQFIATAVAEKVSALQTASYIAERASGADLNWFRRFLNRPGGAPPRPEDQLVEDAGRPVPGVQEQATPFDPRPRLRKRDGVIRFVAEKELRSGPSKGRNQWNFLKRFFDRPVQQFVAAARAETARAPEGTFQQRDWWNRELAWCLERGYIRIE